MNDISAEEIEAIEGNPTKNKDAVLLVKQEDGNWRGFMKKSGTLVQARQSDPQIVLQMLLTHE